ncbi:MAG: exonuclease SbcCD subunit D [Galactobacter sp.]
MRFLHTSDWHLGRSFHGTDLLEQQRAAMDRVVDAAVEHRVDAVLVPGDVYDRALPGTDVVALLNDTLERLVTAGVKVVITSGNHDSAVRLGFGAALMQAAGVYLRTEVAALTDPVVFSEAGQDVLVYGIPYLDPGLTAEALGVERSAGHPGVTAAATARIREHALAYSAAHPDREVRTVVLSHLFAAGGAETDSERPLVVGQLGQVPLSVFQGFDYTALGHLHGAQAPTKTIRYSGSPLPYSFSEAEQDKAGLIVDLDPGKDVEVTSIAWPPPRPLARLKGRIEDLLADPEYVHAEGAWCQITLTDPERPATPMERLKKRFPYALDLLFEPEGREQDTRTYRQRVRRDADPAAVALGFVDHVRERSADPAEEELIREVVGQAGMTEVSA